MRTLNYIPISEEAAIKTIDEINAGLSFPNHNGHTLTYALPETDEKGNVKPIVISHEAQTIPLSIPLVSNEVINSAEVTADKIKAGSEIILPELVDNAKNYVVDIATIRTTATDEQVEALKQDGNTIITASPEITQKYCVVSDEKGVVLSDYVASAKIETLKIVEQFADLNAIPATKFEPLPTKETVDEGNKAMVYAGKMYDYNGNTVLCIQTHERTIYAPETTPALFSFYRTNSDTLAWIANEKVSVGWKRIYDGKTYVCSQAHMTLESWTPDKATTLWSLVVTSSEWAYPVSYKVNDIVTYQGKTYTCIQANTSNVSWTPTATINVLWKLK